MVVQDQPAHTEENANGERDEHHDADPHAEQDRLWNSCRKLANKPSDVSGVHVLALEARKMRWLSGSVPRVSQGRRCQSTQRAAAADRR